MILYHATHRANLDSIYRSGLSTRFACSPGMRVWACCKKRVRWAMLHAVKRHGGQIADIIVLKIRCKRGQFKRSAHPGLWNSRADVNPAQITFFWNFSDAAR